MKCRAYRVLAVSALLFLGGLGCRTILDHQIERGKAPLPEIPDEAAVAEHAGDWTEWRGPGRDGAVHGVELPTDLPGETWPEAWRVTVGEGLSGIVVGDGRIYCHSRVGDQEVVTCHEAGTGNVVWSRQSELGAEFSQPWYASGITGGPLSTPTLAGDRLYTLGILGRLQCLDAATGEVRFSVTPEELDGSPSKRTHGHAASPLVHDGKLYVIYATGKAPQLLALDAETGEVIWRAVEENTSYASVVAATFQGTPQIIVRTWGRVLGVDVEDGKVLWEFPAPSGEHTRDCATPLVIGDFVYTTNTFHGTLAIHVARRDSQDGEGWEAKSAWRTGSLAGSTASPIYYEGRLYGLHRKYRFDCISARTGERVWIERVFGEHLSILRFGDRILCLDDRGTLALVRLTPRKYEELGRWKVGEYTWAHPGVDPQHLYFRDGKDLVALPLGAP